MSYSVRPLALPAAPAPPQAARWARPAAVALVCGGIALAAAWGVLWAFRLGVFVDSRLAAGILYCAEPPDPAPFTSTCQDHACLEREARILLDQQAAAVKYELRCESG